MRAVTIRVKKQNGEQSAILAGLPYFRVDIGVPRVRVKDVKDVPMPAGLPRAAVYTRFFHIDAVANFSVREETREGPRERELYSHITTKLSVHVVHVADVKKEPGGTTAYELAHHDILALPV